MRWKVEWLVDRSGGPASIPAYRFLKGLPVNVRVQLLAIPPFASVDDFIQADLKS